MARRPSARKKVSEEIDDLNLVPIMNLVVCLILMVLYGASFIQLGVVNVNSKFGTGKQSEEPNEDEKPLNLTLALGEDGFYLSAQGADLREVLGLGGAEVPEDPAAGQQQGPTVPKIDGKYDFVGLYQKLVTIKGQFEKETIVNLAADRAVEFEYVIKTMDSIRVKLDKESFSDLAEFQRAKVKIDEQGRPELLWPDVVLAVAE